MLPTSICLLADHANNDDLTIVYISAKRMKDMKIPQNSAMLITGMDGKKIVCRVQKTECAIDKIQMNKLIRNNLGIRLNEPVNVQLCKDFGTAIVVNLKMILNPAHKDITIDLGTQLLSLYIRNNKKRFFCEGNRFVVRGGCKDVEFLVITTTPGPYCIMDNKTRFTLANSIISEDQTESIGYNNIGGYRAQLSQVREMELPLYLPFLFRQFNATPPRILMHGTQGVGKLLMAKALAAEMNARFVLINAANIDDRSVQLIIEKLERKFKEAIEDCPSVLVIDDLEVIASSQAQEAGKILLIETLVSLINKIEKGTPIVLVGITRLLPNVHDSVLGLFQNSKTHKIIAFGMPNQLDRYEILEILTKNMTVPRYFSIQDIVKITSNYTGENLAVLCEKVIALHLQKLDVTKSNKTTFLYSNSIPTKLFEDCIQLHEKKLG